MTTTVDMTVDEVRRVSGDIVSAVVSGSGIITFDVYVDCQRTTRTDTLVIAPTPIVFSLVELDALLPEFARNTAISVPTTWVPLVATTHTDARG